MTLEIHSPKTKNDSNYGFSESVTTKLNQQAIIPILADSIYKNPLTAFYDKLKFSDKDIIINEIFKVDLNGQAYFLKNNNFNPLCIVAVNCDKFKMTQNIGLGNQKIDFKTMEILHKVLFLLNPNTKDSVFMNQLTDKIKKILMENKIVN